MNTLLFLSLIFFLGATVAQNVTLSDEEVQFFVNLQTQTQKQSIEKMETELNGFLTELNNTLTVLQQNRRRLLDGGDMDGSQESPSLSEIACSKISLSTEGQVVLSNEQSQLLTIIHLKGAIESHKKRIEKDKAQLVDLSNLLAYNLLHLNS